LRLLKRKAGVRTRRRPWHVRNKGLLFLLLAAAGIVCWSFVSQQPSLDPFSSIPVQSPDHHSLDSASEPTWSASVYSNGRPVYPYSVIPGGISGPLELRDAALHDPVVARHFAGFNYDRAHLVKVTKAQSAYVSYRIGSRLYWTRHKISLHRDEMLITDGTIVARTRCGNRIAAAPLDAGSPLEPSSEELDSPRASSMPLIPAALVDPIPSPLPDPSIPEANSPMVVPAAKHVGIPWIIPPVYIPEGSSGHPGAPLAVTPEPGSLLLISSGLAIVGWRVRKARRKS
jgi:PEP-CTERM motif